MGYGVAALTAATMVLAMWGSPAWAQQASSDGYALKANIALLGGLAKVLDVQPQAAVGFAPQAASFADQQIIADMPGVVAAGGLLNADAGLLKSRTEYIAPDAPGGFAVAGAHAQATDVDISALGSLVPLSIIAPLLESRAIVMGSCPQPQPLAGAALASVPAPNDYLFVDGFDGGLQGIGGSSGYDEAGSPGSGGENGLTVKVAGSPLLNIPVDPEPNTKLDLSGLLGLLGGSGYLALNEQITGGNGTNSRSLAVNALHLYLNVPLLITADVVIAHSAARLSCP